MKTHVVPGPTKTKRKRRKKKERKTTQTNFENNLRKPKSNSTLLISYTSFARLHMPWIFFCFCFYCCAIVIVAAATLPALLSIVASMPLLLAYSFRFSSSSFLQVSIIVSTMYNQFGCFAFCKLQRFNLVMVGLILSHVSNVYTVHIYLIFFLLSFNTVSRSMYRWYSESQMSVICVIIINERSSSISNHWIFWSYFIGLNIKSISILLNFLIPCSMFKHIH